MTLIDILGRFEGLLRFSWISCCSAFHCPAPGLDEDQGGLGGRWMIWFSSRIHPVQKVWRQVEHYFIKGFSLAFCAPSESSCRGNNTECFQTFQTQCIKPQRPIAYSRFIIYTLLLIFNDGTQWCLYPNGRKRIMVSTLTIEDPNMLALVSIPSAMDACIQFWVIKF